MKGFFNSHYMLYLLAALLLLVFFLPDIIGPLPALAAGSVVIGFAFYVYGRWSKEPEQEVGPDNKEGHKGEDNEE